MRYGLTTHSRVPGTLALALAFALVGRSYAVAAPPDFAHDIVPILRKHCAECHGGSEAKGGFSINTRASLLDATRVVPGDAAGSPLIERVSSDDPDVQMPPKENPRVPEEDVALLRVWIEAGVAWEEGFSFAARSYEPPLRPRRPEFPPPVDGRRNPVDRIIDAYLARRANDLGDMRSLSDLQPLGDAAFLRRVHLDLIGLLPDPDTLAKFLADESPDKRSRVVRELLADHVRYAEHWLTFWNDLLRNDYTGTGFITGGRKQISRWLYESLVANKPFDQFARELIAPPTPESRGFIDGIKWRGNVSAAQSLEVQFAQNISQALLGINMKCASCHDSFIDRWKLRDAYGLAAIYANRPLKIHRCDKPTGETATAAWLFPELGKIDPQAPQPQKLQQLAALMTHPQNGRFTRTVVNRLWHQLMGRGIVHPPDAMQSPPWNADLLDYLAVHLQKHGYDLKQTLELIATSRAYQTQAEVLSREAADGDYVFRGPRAKRLTAEQFVDAIWQLTGAAPKNFDAPVIRGAVDPQAIARTQLAAKWIWAKSAVRETPAAGETIALMKRFRVDRPIKSAGAAVTCDNEFTLHVNGSQVARDKDWQTVEVVPLTEHLREGENRIVVIARNAGAGPNAAGLFFEGCVKFAEARKQRIVSDGSWQFSSDFPSKTAVGKWPLEEIDWQPAATLDPLDSWSEVIDAQAPRALVQSMAAADLMVRASLLKSDFLMRSLGRPNRDQIVSTRPDELTTLEAIELSNNPSLARLFAAGGRRLAVRDWSDTGELINYIYRAALTREPTLEEMALLLDALGDKPNPQAIEDTLWAVCMTPEFLLIR